MACTQQHLGMYICMPGMLCVSSLFTYVSVKKKLIMGDAYHVRDFYSCGPHLIPL